MMGMFSALESPPVLDLPPEKEIFGRSPTISTIQRSVKKAASANRFLQGGASTAKKILARFINRQSQWGNGVFVELSRTAILGTRLESEPFGYQKGAFPDRRGTKPTWRWPRCGQADESTGNLVLLDRVF
jgi:DNA-binding NtrC family response regulator